MIKIRGTKDSTTALMAYPGVWLSERRVLANPCFGVISQNPAVFSMRQRMMIRMLGGVMQATPDQCRERCFRNELNRSWPKVTTVNRFWSHSMENSTPSKRKPVEMVILMIRLSLTGKRLIPFHRGRRYGPNQTTDLNRGPDNQPVECVAKLYPTRGIASFPTSTTQ